MKHKLLKDLPWITAWAEFIEHEKTEKFDRLAFSHIPCVWPQFAKDNPDFFEPIVEKKRYEDLTEKDKLWYIHNYGHVLNDYFEKDDCRSATFLTREEAEDEHKRREWAVRPDKFIPKEGEYYFVSTSRGVESWDMTNSIIDFVFINLWLAFRTREDCEKAIKEHDLIRLFYTVR